MSHSSLGLRGPGDGPQQGIALLTYLALVGPFRLTGPVLYGRLGMLRVGRDSDGTWDTKTRGHLRGAGNWAPVRGEHGGGQFPDRCQVRTQVCGMLGDWGGGGCFPDPADLHQSQRMETMGLDSTGLRIMDYGPVCHSG